MKLKKLLLVLSEQEKNLNNLLESGKEKQDALVSNNGNKLNETIATEEKGLFVIQQKEDERLSIMTELFNYYGINSKSYKLEILINWLKGRLNQKVLNGIEETEKRIKNTINDITRINYLNMMLIQQSRSLLNDTIQAISNSSNKSIVDRKG